MIEVSVVLWLVGLGSMLVGWWQLRGPLARMRELSVTQANLRRYDVWRGSRTDLDSGPTGADVMRDMLRRRVITWGVVIAVGVVLVLLGFAIR